MKKTTRNLIHLVAEKMTSYCCCVDGVKSTRNVSNCKSEPSCMYIIEVDKILLLILFFNINIILILIFSVMPFRYC